MWGAESSPAVFTGGPRLTGSDQGWNTDSRVDTHRSNATGGTPLTRMASNPSNLTDAFRSGNELLRSGIHIADPHVPSGRRSLT